MRDSRYSEQPFRLQKLLKSQSLNSLGLDSSPTSASASNSNNHHPPAVGRNSKRENTCKVIYLLEGSLTSDHSSLSGNITLAVAEKALLAHQIQHNFIIKNTSNLEDTVAYCRTFSLRSFILLCSSFIRIILYFTSLCSHGFMF